MYAREIMTRHIMTIGPMATVKEAIRAESVQDHVDAGRRRR